MNKEKNNIKTGNTNKVNVASVLFNFFLGGVVRAANAKASMLGMRSKSKESKYDPHQGKRECARRVKQMKWSKIERGETLGK